MQLVFYFTGKETEPETSETDYYNQVKNRKKLLIRGEPGLFVTTAEISQVQHARYPSKDLFGDYKNGRGFGNVRLQRFNNLFQIKSHIKAYNIIW